MHDPWNVASSSPAKNSPAPPVKKPSNIGPVARPAGPTGKKTSHTVNAGKFGTRTVVTTEHLPKGPSESDLTFQRARNAIGPAALDQAANPRVAALQHVLGDVSGIPALTHAVRTHNVPAAAAQAAMFLPFGRIGRAIKGGADVVKAVEGATKAEGAVKAARHAPAYVSPKYPAEGVGGVVDRAAEPGYLYHRTTLDRLEGIRKRGLHPAKPQGQPAGVYLAPHPLTARGLSWKPDHGSIYVRVAKSDVPHARETGNHLEQVTSKSIPAERLQYLGHDGTWHPVVSKAAKAVVQKTAPTVPTLQETARGALKGAKQVRAGQESIRSQERAARAQAFGKALQANPTIEGARQASAHLAGKYTALHFGGFEGFTPETLDAMVKHVADHPNLRPFDQKRAITAIKNAASGKVPTKGEHKLLHEAFGPEATAQIMQSVSKLHKAKAAAYDVANLPRSLMASFDASGILRQGLMVGTGHPVMFAKNVPDYLKAIRSEKFYATGMNQLHARPNAVNGVYHKMGLELTELTPRAGAGAREESFRSPLAEKIPGVRMSGRGFTLFLDKARADLADHMYAKAIKQGRDPNDQHLLESIGDVANSASGRGDLGTGPIGRSQEGLNLLLFSPRLIKSRVDFINPVWYAKLDPLARHQAYKAMGGLVVMMATALEIGRVAGAKVNLDPRSADFAKIRLGNTRLDLAGGFQQYTRLLSEIATQQTVSTSGKVTHLGQAGPGKTSDWDVAFRFLRSKLAPLASAAVDVSQRQNVVGQPLTWQNQVVSRATPLSGQDAVSVGKEAAAKAGVPAGILAGLGAFGLSAIGGGVQNYKPKPVKGGSDPWGAGGGSSPDPWGVSP